MLTIITPQQFRTIAWKNGLGETTELAINDHGSLTDFDWRLSMASVVSDGTFSNFDGYYRNLVLIAGTGLILNHDDKHKDKLIELLDIASFSGNFSTFAKLTQGSIKDFNIITKADKVSANVQCYVRSQQVLITLNNTCLCFAYSLSDEIIIESNEKPHVAIPKGHLAKLNCINHELNKNDMQVNIIGKNMIIIQLDMLTRFNK